MARFRRTPMLVLAGGLALALAIGLVAILDHEHKREVMNRMQVDEWFCLNRGERCGLGSSAAVERRWNQREIGYTLAVAVIVSSSAAVAWRLRRRPPADRRSPSPGGHAAP